MMHRKYIFFIAFLSLPFFSLAQSLSARVTDEAGKPVALTTVELLRSADSGLVKIQMTDSLGHAEFLQLPSGSYLIKLSRVGYTTQYSKPVDLGAAPVALSPFALKKASGQLDIVTIRSSRPFIEMRAGKTVVNVEASITSAGSTAMEVLEKLPGVMVDKDGNISLKGRNGVVVMMDGKQTYLDPAQLANLLNGMSASQVSQIEIMENPGARYDAAGNAGIINIKTKKNRQTGFNGNINTTYSQGRYPRNNNSIQLNFKTGKWNFFGNYSFNYIRQFTDIYALRTYMEADGKTVASYLEQPSYMRVRIPSHIARVGVDYSISNKTTASLTMNGVSLYRSSWGNNPAVWKDAGHVIDSMIRTQSRSTMNWKNLGGNLNLRHVIDAKREITADADLIGYDMEGRQFFENKGVSPVAYSEGTRAFLPGSIRIFSAKTDYTANMDAYKWEAGLKTTHTKTNNLADYDFFDGTNWQKDYGKTNHFLYNEKIHAAYASMENKGEKLSVQGGLRLEMTSYDAHQLGNLMVKDSAFSKSYSSLFPTLFASWKMDSINSFSFSAGRRIDRPPFQRLNPFLFVINKYTYERGNPFYKPQYAWNFEVQHSFKNVLITGLSYSYTKDYFSQIFPIDSNGIVYYSVGNMGSMKNWGLSVSTQLSPLNWWSFQLSAQLHHKIMKGFVEQYYEMDITQVHFNLNNQFRFGSGWTGELSGYYTSKSQHDIQEIVDPAGQLSIGISKSILQNKGTIRFGARDLFYTQWMKGLSFFNNAMEYFKLTRDTRVGYISFTYRFGKAYKTVKRSQGAAGDEMQRVGNG